jgi:CBS-domain-containing membrane protein
MTSPAVTIHPGAPLAAAARRMTQHHIRLLPVVGPEGDLIGVVSRRNLLSIFLRKDDDIAEEVRTVLGDLLLIDQAKVAVSAQDGTVTLAGLAADEDSRRAAIRVASEVDGVAHVISELTVPPSAGSPSVSA